MNEKKNNHFLSPALKRKNLQPETVTNHIPKSAKDLKHTGSPLQLKTQRTKSPYHNETHIAFTFPPSKIFYTIKKPTNQPTHPSRSVTVHQFVMDYQVSRSGGQRTIFFSGRGPVNRLKEGDRGRWGERMGGGFLEGSLPTLWRGRFFLFFDELLEMFYLCYLCCVVFLSVGKRYQSWWLLGDT